MKPRVKNKKEAIFWNKKQYDSDFGKNYDKSHQINFKSYIFKKIEEDLKFILDKNQNDNINILDIGCGTGKLTLFLMKFFENAEFYALDISGVMLDNLRRKVPKNMKGKINYIEKDATNFLRSNKNITFDIIATSGALHHFYDYLDLIKLISKKLNKNSFLYIANEPYKKDTSGVKKYILRSLRIQDRHLFYLKRKQENILKYLIYFIQSFVHFITRDTLLKFFRKSKEKIKNKKYYYSEVQSDGLELYKIIKILKKNNFNVIIKEGPDFKNEFYFKLANNFDINDHFRLIGEKK